MLPTCERCGREPTEANKLMFLTDGTAICQECA